MDDGRRDGGKDGKIHGRRKGRKIWPLYLKQGGRKGTGLGVRGHRFSSVQLFKLLIINLKFYICEMDNNAKFTRLMRMNK